MLCSSSGEKEFNNECATFGPIPVTFCSSSKRFLADAFLYPKSFHESSRTTSEVKSSISSPAFALLVISGATFTSYPIPETLTTIEVRRTSSIRPEI